MAKKIQKTVNTNTVKKENKGSVVTSDVVMAIAAGFCIITLITVGIYTNWHVPYIIPNTSEQTVDGPSPKKHSSPVFKEEGSDKTVEIIQDIDLKKVKSNISDNDTLRMIFMRSHVSYPITKARYLAVSLGIGVDDTISKLSADKKEKVISALMDKKISCR